MTTAAENGKFHEERVELEASRKAPDAVQTPPREPIQTEHRCRLCGRVRAVDRQFGVCSSCFRSLAGDGLIPQS